MYRLFFVDLWIRKSNEFELRVPLGDKIGNQSHRLLLLVCEKKVSLYRRKSLRNWLKLT